MGAQYLKLGGRDWQIIYIHIIYITHIIYPFRYIFIYNKKFTITGGVVSPRSEKLTLLELEKYERSLKLKPEFLKDFIYSALTITRISPKKKAE